MRSDRSRGSGLPTRYVSGTNKNSWDGSHVKNELKKLLETVELKQYRGTSGLSCFGLGMGRVLYLCIPTGRTSPFAASSDVGECAAHWSSQERVPSVAPITSIDFTRCYSPVLERVTDGSQGRHHTWEVGSACSLSPRMKEAEIYFT
jgi:hypothetical protein